MTSNYMPFFREGLLCLPKATCQLLVESGLDIELITRASTGLHLDDDRQHINAIHEYIQAILDTLDPMVQRILSSQDVEYMLTYTNLEEVLSV